MKSAYRHLNFHFSTLSLQMQRNWYWTVFGLILVLAAVLRLYQLGQVPAGMTWDEAAVGYNGYAIWNTRRDEWLERLPISFRSFGDYKAPLAIYMTAISTGIFGLSLTVIRLPFALSGMLAVAAWGLLLRYTLWSESTPKKQAYSLAGMLLLALSPWHLHLTRTGFESGLALTQGLWGFVFLESFVHGQWLPAGKRWRQVALATSVILFACTFYTYHSSKIVVPLLLLLYAWWQRAHILSNWRWYLSAGIGGSLLLLPLLLDTLWGAGGERFTQASLFGLGLSTPNLLVTMVTHFFAHFSPSFLVLGATETLRHGAGQWSMLLPTTFALASIGLFSVISASAKSLRRPWLLAVVILVIGLLPAAIGRDVPHSNRAFFALPGFLLLALIGCEWLTTWLQKTRLNQKVSGNHSETNIIVKLFLGYLVLLHALFFFRYLSYYYGEFRLRATADYQEGYLPMLAEVISLEEQHNVEKIIISDEYGQPYIYTLFAKQTNPIAYQGGALVKYEFKDVSIGDLSRRSAIVVASLRDKKELTFSRADSIIFGSDGEPRFAIYVVKNE